MQDHGRSRVEVEVTPHQHASLGCAYRECGTAIVGFLWFYVRFIVSLRQEVDDVGYQFFCTFAATTFYQAVETIVALVFHIIQAVVEFLGRQGSLYQWTELQPQQHTCDHNQSQHTKQQNLQCFLHKYLYFLGCLLI